ncbi:XRE family transcriptional regulator [bacterium]|nr:XRE family transcriptional regulator [bacterium]
MQELKRYPEFAELYAKEELIDLVSQLVRQARKESNLSQQELAERVGTSQPAIARLESGRSKTAPTLDVLARVARSAGKKLVISFQ